MPSAIEKIKEKAVPILKEHDVLRSAVFGSYARGEETKDSDVDMLVEVPRGTTLFDLVGLQYELEDALKKKVDVLTYRSLHRLLKDIILKEAIQIL